MFIIFSKVFQENCTKKTVEDLLRFLNLGIGELSEKDHNCIEFDEVAQVSR